MALLEVNNLKTSFYTRYGIARAVDGVSFKLEKGETVGIVGESGSGKSVSCYSLLGLIACPPGRIESGSAIFNDTDLLSCTQKELREIRGNTISMVFQDPMSSLNPYLTIGIQLTEHLIRHKGLSKYDAGKKAVNALMEVGIQDSESRLKQHPHQLSGGQRQRVMIAMALACRPALLIADSATSLMLQYPSAEDLAFTRRMANAGEVVGLRLVDHLIVGGGGRWVSLKKRGGW